MLEADLEVPGHVDRRRTSDKPQQLDKLAVIGISRDWAGAY
jgi:hypothetical protein